MAAWGVLCGGLYYSFWGQVLDEGPWDISGLPSWFVAVVKGGMFAVAILALVRSVRTVWKKSEMSET